MTKNTGGPAFPCEVLGIDEHGEYRKPYEGMTLRDYFASRASEEDINQHLWKGFNETAIKTAPDGTKYETSIAARWTREQAKYRYADAMLKAREV